jgi:hypothetical protein
MDLTVNLMLRPFYARERMTVTSEWQVGWVPGPVWKLLRGEKFLSLPEFEPRTVHPVAKSINVTPARVL